MAEKLTESTWTGFTKKQSFKLDDAPLVKALAKFEKTSDAKPEPRLEALEDIVELIPKQVTALSKRKKELGDKAFGEVKDKLYALLDIAETLKKESEKAVEDAKKGGDEEEEEESPALLTSKMIPLIREVRKGELVLQSLVAVTGKETVVLLSRKSISPSRGKLLKEQMTNPGGLKFIRGQCTFEDNALSFVVQSGAAGLAKKIKAALLAQTDLRLKVRVRGEDPNDVDEEGEDDEAVGQGAAPGAGKSEAQARQPDPLKARFDDRLAQMEPRLADALRKGTGDVSKLRAVSAFAREKAEAGVYADGLKALDALEKLLPPATGAGKTAAGTDSTIDPAVAFNARLAALMPKLKAAAKEIRAMASEAGLTARKLQYDQANAQLDEAERLLAGGGAATAGGSATAGATGGNAAPTGKPLAVWADAKDRVGERISQLQSKLRGTKHPLFIEIADKGLNSITKRLQVGLQVSLMDYDKASTPEEKAKFKSNALSQVASFRSFVQSNAAIRLIDENPLGVKADIRSTLAGAFDSIERELAS